MSADAPALLPSSLGIHDTVGQLTEGYNPPPQNPSLCVVLPPCNELRANSESAFKRTENMGNIQLMGQTPHLIRQQHHEFQGPKFKSTEVDSSVYFSPLEWTLIISPELQFWAG